MNGVAFIVSDVEVGHVLFDRIRDDSVEGFLQAFLASSDVLSARKAMVILAARHKTHFMVFPVSELMREGVLYSTSVAERFDADMLFLKNLSSEPIGIVSAAQGKTSVFALDIGCVAVLTKRGHECSICRQDNPN